MPRKPNIKWRESDLKKLEKKIERFNNKIYRVRHRNPEIADKLPDTIKKSDKLEMIENLKNSPRSEFNKALNSLDRFSKRGAEKLITSKTGNTVTQWEKNEISLKVAQINRARTIERKKYENEEATSRGKPLGMKRGEMGSERMIELNPKTFNFDKIKGGKEWDKFKASVNRQSSYSARQEKLDRYKANYIKGLEENFGEYARDIINTLEKIPSKLMVDTYFIEQEATIKFYYEKQQMNTILDVIRNIWSDVLEDYTQNS